MDEKKAKRQRKKIRSLVQKAYRLQTTEDASPAEEEEIIRKLRALQFKHHKTIYNYQNLPGRGRPPRAPVTLAEIGITNEDMQENLDLLAQGKITKKLNRDEWDEDNNPVHRKDGSYIRTGGRGTTRAMPEGKGKRPPEPGERRAYDEFIRSTKAQREAGTPLTQRQLDQYDKVVYKKDGDTFRSHIRNHVTNVPKPDNEDKKCSFGKYKNKFGQTRCLKNPVHSVPGRSHHLDTGVGPGNPIDEQDFGDGGGEAPERPVKASKKSAERRSSRIRKLQNNYWDRPSSRRKLNRT